MKRPMKRMHSKVADWLNWATAWRLSFRHAANASDKRYYLTQARECIKLARDYRINCEKCLP